MSKNIILIILIATYTFMPSSVIAGALCILKPAGYNNYYDRKPDHNEQQLFDSVYSTLCPRGCGSVNFFKNASVPNAMAYSDQFSTPTIRYNPNFIGRLGDDATWAIFAHELGHIIDFQRRSTELFNNRWMAEARADSFAGCALSKANRPINSLDPTLNGFSSSPNYPSNFQRKDLVHSSYKKCNK